MAQPLYFLPNLRASAAEGIPLRKQVLKERGLAEVFADVAYDEQPFAELTGRGPGDLSGCVMAYQTPSGDIPRRLGFYPREQAWTPVGDGSLLWIGVDTAEPPKPEELARKKQYGGYRVQLGEHEWLIPTVRRPDGSTELPTDMVWDATGRLIEPIKPLYQQFWNESAEVATWFFDGVEPVRARALELAIRAMSINYRYDRMLHNIIRAIDSESLMLVLAATIDAPSAPKKTDQVTSAEHGSQDSSPVTDQPEATCV